MKTADYKKNLKFYPWLREIDRILGPDVATEKKIQVFELLQDAVQKATRRTIQDCLTTISAR
jgi:hypothetical protein